MTKLGAPEKTAASDLSDLLSPDTIREKFLSDEKYSDEILSDDTALDGLPSLPGTDSGISSDLDPDHESSLDVDSEIAAMEADLAEIAEDIQHLADEMKQDRKGRGDKKNSYDIRMAVAAAKLAPIYARISLMPPEERKHFLMTPSKNGGVKKTWPDSRAIDPYAVMLAHKYLFDKHANRERNINTLCNRIGYTAAALVQVGKLEFEDAREYVMKNGRASKISLAYSAKMQKKEEIGLSVLDATPSKAFFSMDSDDPFLPGTYRALLVRKSERVGYDLIHDLAPDEGSMGRIFEKYYSHGKRTQDEQARDGGNAVEEFDIRGAETERLRGYKTKSVKEEIGNASRRGEICQMGRFGEI